LTGHTSTVNCVAYSTNGNQIASGSDDTTVRLWDVKTGECSHILSEQDECVFEVAYSPRGDYLASTCDGDQDKIRLWNVATGACHPNISTINSASFHFAYSPRGDQVAYTEGRDILLWEVETGNILHTLAGHSGVVSVISYSPLGDLVASAGAFDDITVRLWDAETGVCLWILAGHSEYIYSMVFSPKGDRIISSSDDGTVRIWDVGAKTSQRSSSGHNEEVVMVKCSPNGDQVASCSNDMMVRLWDVATGSCQHILRGHSEIVRCIAYSPQGDQIVTGGADTTVRLWDTETGRCTHTLTGHSREVTQIVYSLDQTDQLASCSHNGYCDGGYCGYTVRLWNVRSGECLRTLCENISEVRRAVLSPNSSRIASMSKDRVQLMEVETSDCTDELRGLGVYRSSKMIWSPQGDQVAILRYKQYEAPMALWNIRNNEQDNDKNQAGHGNDDIDHEDDDRNNGDDSVQYTDLECGLAAFSPNGLQIACIRVSHHYDYAVYLYDAVTGRRLWESKSHPEKITSIVYSCCIVTVSSSDSRFSTLG